MRFFSILILGLICTFALGQNKYKSVLNSIDAHQDQYQSVAQEIWSYAEMGYQEERSSALLQKAMPL